MISKVLGSRFYHVIDLLREVTSFIPVILLLPASFSTWA